MNTIDDKKDYGVVNKAMKMIGFTDRERETVWKIVAAIIHLVCITIYVKIFSNMLNIGLCLLPVFLYRTLLLLVCEVVVGEGYYPHYKCWCLHRTVQSSTKWSDSFYIR